VGLLLFLKMLFLPLVLGLWLDAATAPILSATNVDRVRFASENLVGALLLHWVAGITFMLFVTVAVLQLREVRPGDCPAMSL
jgi:E3 ubiquitin-protein ligase MARCH6